MRTTRVVLNELNLNWKELLTDKVFSIEPKNYGYNMTLILIEVDKNEFEFWWWADEAIRAKLEFKGTINILTTYTTLYKQVLKTVGHEQKPIIREDQRKSNTSREDSKDDRVQGRTKTKVDRYKQLLR